MFEKIKFLEDYENETIKQYFRYYVALAQNFKMPKNSTLKKYKHLIF